MSIKELSHYVEKSKYAKYLPSKKRRENWQEIVERVFEMHEEKFKDFLASNEEFKSYFNFTKQLVKDRRILGSQRALQFSSKPILKHNTKLFNCTSTYMDRLEAFSESMYMLLSGCGVGFSVQNKHIKHLPEIKLRECKNGKTFIHTIQDSIEGWADSLKYLFHFYFDNDSKEFEYIQSSYEFIDFDYSYIRPEGAKIAGGFKAPGHSPLKLTLDIIKNKLDSILRDCSNGVRSGKLKSIEVHDIMCHICDAVISGGVRRAAAISLFDYDDDEMLNAKSEAHWWDKNPQRMRANNSVVLNRETCTKEQFSKIFKYVKNFGEPGFVFISDEDTLVNPCLTGDTIILTDKGEISIKELSDTFGTTNSDMRAYSYNVKSKIIELKNISSATITKKNAEIIKLTFTDGKSLKLTPDHRVLTENGYVETGNLNINDKVLSINPDNSSNVSIISNIESIANDDVYDISVIDNHNFYANGICVHNCGEISMKPIIYDEETKKNKTGFGCCNLTEIIGSKCRNEDEFYEACKGASILGTMQAYYVDFKYLSKTSIEIAKRDCLLGVSITGFADNNELLFDPEIQRKGAEIVKKYNKIIADILGINHAKRTNCVKPSGCFAKDVKMKTCLGEMSFKEIFGMNGYNVDELAHMENAFLEPIKKIHIKNENDEYELITKLYVNHKSKLNVIAMGDGTSVKCTGNHKFKTVDGWKTCDDLLVGDEILSSGNSNIKITNIERNAVEDCSYDIEVSGTHTYQLANGAITHNTASIIGRTASGIHPHHARKYLRRVQSKKNENCYKFFKTRNPHAIEENVIGSRENSDACIIFPCEVPSGSIIKSQISALEFLAKIKTSQENWVQSGTNDDINDEGLTHNVSNTVVVRNNEWDDVMDYIYDNRFSFCGISLIASSGDLDYKQPPNITIHTPMEIVKEYGSGSVMASGVIVEALRCYNGDLWEACNDVIYQADYDSKIEYATYDSIFNTHENEIYKSRKKWIIQAKKFADKYFDGDYKKMCYCLKDVDNWKRWCDLTRDWVKVDWENCVEDEEVEVSVDTMGASACSGGSCEINF